MPESSHVGLTPLLVERRKLIDEFEQAIKHAANDQVKTEHGNVGEAAVRQFFDRFLPKKYGVTKGYIITPDGNYAGHLEEWDIIIYDALESPVLTLRRTQDELATAGKRGIPVEYVKAVVEVKASFDKGTVEEVVTKLKKLDDFGRTPLFEKDLQGHLPENLLCAAVFFTTRVAKKKNFVDALQAFSELWQVDPRLPFAGALILRGQYYQDLSAQIEMIDTDEGIDIEKHLPPGGEASAMFKAVPGNHAKATDSWVVSTGFGENEFWSFMMGFVHALNDMPSPRVAKINPYSYGVDKSKADCVPCFPVEADASAPTAPVTTTDAPKVE